MGKMLRVPVFTQTMIWSLVIITLLMGWYPPEGMAMLAPAVSTGTESVSGPNRVTDLQKVQSVLESKVVRQRLEDFGLTPEEINARLPRLSDDQLHQLATQIDALTPGGNGLGIIVALLVIAILVVILVYLLGHRIVITKQGEEK
ncbi:MAG: PA2779 family protein [Nitrospiraceae bacterium]